MRLAPQDVEGAYITHLRPLLAVPVSTRIPNPRPARHVRVTRAGGNRADLVQERPLLIFECWASDSVTAFNLASDTWGHVAATEGSMVAGVPVTRVDLSSPINQPDPDTEATRYTFTAQPRARLKEMT